MIISSWYDIENNIGYEIENNIVQIDVDFENI